MYVYQIQNVQVIFQYKALHGPLEICEYPQSFRRREGRGQGGSTKLSGTVPLLWINRDNIWICSYYSIFTVALLSNKELSVKHNYIVLGRLWQYLARPSEY